MAATEPTTTAPPAKPERSPDYLAGFEAGRLAERERVFSIVTDTAASRNPGLTMELLLTELPPATASKIMESAPKNQAAPGGAFPFLPMNGARQ